MIGTILAGAAGAVAAPGEMTFDHGLGVQDQPAHPQPGPQAAVPPGPDLPLYSLRDLLILFAGFQWSTAQMFQELRAYDARRLGTRFEVPFVLLQGESDVITPTTLAQEYFEEVEAPTKELALIPDAGRFAAFTQPERFLAELRRTRVAAEGAEAARDHDQCRRPRPNSRVRDVHPRLSSARRAAPLFWPPSLAQRTRSSRSALRSHMTRRASPTPV